MKLTPKKQSGFTLIEIVIVLAIAALIMVIVFLAVAGAQRSRRDTQRKNDVNRISSLLENSASANSGNYPNCTGGSTCDTWTATSGGAAYAGTFGTKYLANESLKDPSTGNNYNVVIGALPDTCAANTMYYNLINNRTYKVSVCLESGSYSQPQ